ncbi:MAG: lipopolysaccharide heptosyltransferase II [Candidatus Omnitrophica bacterium]|nr:lipopolysaccharide heptosyltransferase II [Candidatus Omnitrophota bacterium]
MKNILVVSVNWLGDAVFETPVFRALKTKYPGSWITCLCVPRVADVLAMCPDIDEIMVYDERGKDQPFFSRVFLIMKILKKRFDAAFILRKSLSRSLLLMLAGIPLRIGFADKSWDWLLTHVVDDDGLDEKHRSDVYVSVVESLGISTWDRSCRLVAPESFVRGVRESLAQKGISDQDRLIAVNTGGNWNLKQWPPEKFAELVRKVYARGLGKVVLPGAVKDVDRVNQIAALSGVSPIVMAGETGIKCLAGLFTRVNLLITADTGPLHLASALGASVISIFGPTRPEITGPRGPGRAVILQKDVGCNRAPCYYLECGDNKCMKEVSVEDVLQAIQQIQS